MKFRFLPLILTLAACSPGVQPSSGPVASPNELSPTNPSLSLADYLKRVPGVQVLQHGTGGSSTVVLVRGNNTMSGEREPLFVINGVNAGFGYENVAPLVDVNDIQSVRVLKSGQETAAYGLQGNNGVILIRTKR
jgi:TonB-dependent SusC/RagA subfamily outer membrane receptor